MTTYKCRLVGTRRWTTIRIWPGQDAASVFVHNAVCADGSKRTHDIEVLGVTGTFRVSFESLMVYSVEWRS